MRSFLKKGWFLVFLLVALRVSIGWHFYKEGVTKNTSESFTSAHFLSAAKGPFAGFYHRMVHDPQGDVRLDLEQTEAAWETYRSKLAAHYQFDDAQTQRSTQVTTRFGGGLQQYLEEQEEDLDEYERDRLRLESAKANPNLRDIEFQAIWIAEQEKALKGKLQSFLNDIDELWDQLEDSLNRIATLEQRNSHRRYELSLGSGGMRDVAVVDQWMPLFHMLVGGCLIIGLGTRISAVAAALFLFSVVLSQPPWVSGAEPVYYQTVEMFAALAVAAAGAGRWAGLDFFWGPLCSKCCKLKKQQAKQEQPEDKQAKPEKKSK